MIRNSQDLLKEYVATRSEAAFQELAARYVGLVYGTALRLVSGDVQLAEDVSQSVFVSLAQSAGSFSPKVMLGGWLYQRTFHLATKAARGERRRLARERQAVEMNTLQNDSDQAARQIKPFLDEALMQLRDEDRKAILLRFFEDLDFRGVGAALDISEDAARMKVSRALDKLHVLLTRRGVVVPAAGFGAALGAEAATGAPAGLAAKLATGALAVPAGGLLHTVTVHIMNATKLKSGLAIAVVALSVAAPFVFEHRVEAKIRPVDDFLRQQKSHSTALAGENDRLSRILAGTSMAKDQWDELEKLRAEAAALQRKTNSMVALRDENRQLRNQFQRREGVIETFPFLRGSLLAAIFYKNDHGHWPASMDDIIPAFASSPAAGAANPLRDQYEWVYDPPNPVTFDSNLIALRQIEPSVHEDGGEPYKIYEFADGHAEIIAMPVTRNGETFNSFQDFENAYIPKPPVK